MRGVRNYIDVMSPQEVQMVHNTSLRILEEIGLQVPNQEILKMCEELGAIVDYQTEIIKIPANVMEKLLDKVKKESYWDYENSVRNDLTPSISTQVFYYDYATKTRRYGRVDDIKKGIKLIEELDNFKGTSAIVVPADVPANTTDLVGFHTVYSYAKKEGGTFILSPTSAKYIIEMSRVMGRGCGYFLETVSPLRFRKESLDMALTMAKMGCGVGIGPMVIGGAIGPVTIAGNCTLQNAELLGSMFVGNAITGQEGFGYGSFNHTMDMRTMECSFGSPNQALLGMAAAQMGRYYHLGVVSNNGLTDSLAPDYQCGMEKATNSIFALLAGCAGMGGQGIVSNDQGISLEQLVLDNEYISVYNHIMSGFEVNEETLAFDAIKEAGIGGDFVALEHTVDNMHDTILTSKFFNRSSFGSWENMGKPELFDRVHAYVEEVTAGYQDMEPVVSPEVFEELNRIRAEGEKELAWERENGLA